MAAGDQHLDHHRHRPDGLPDPEHPDRDNGAIHAKLDELIRAMVDADNEDIGMEHLTDEELKQILEKVEQNAPSCTRSAGGAAARARRSPARRQSASNRRQGKGLTAGHPAGQLA